METELVLKPIQFSCTSVDPDFFCHFYTVDVIKGLDLNCSGSLSLFLLQLKRQIFPSEGGDQKRAKSRVNIQLNFYPLTLISNEILMLLPGNRHVLLNINATYICAVCSPLFCPQRPNKSINLGVRE